MCIRDRKWAGETDPVAAGLATKIPEDPSIFRSCSLAGVSLRRDATGTACGGTPTATGSLEELLEGLLFVGHEGVLPDAIATVTIIGDPATGPDPDISFLNLMLAVLKVEEVAGQSAAEIPGLQAFQVSCFHLVAKLAKHAGGGAGTTIDSTVAW